MAYKDPETKREADRRWRANNAETKREAERRRYANNREKVREVQRRYRANNREKTREKGREAERRYRANNREKTREAVRRWSAANKHEFLFHYGTRCRCCGTDRDLTIDHIRPGLPPEDFSTTGRKPNPQQVIRRLKADGWPKGQVQTLCAYCNIRKGKQEACPCGGTGRQQVKNEA